ncbi:TIGR03943 family protein [Amycolatopsis antarctica]|uniref:TIGR03943 family protein n=1 Tax=Amycolatopsis antarctica TaxID=1854586 RepID=A0A263D9V4_9PSEU|nr:TIGR03943 family protein [Amycolatopsis antarctica]OZM74317.1 TIGR03943 family protein [Amycolatopsis antarctica]
MRRETQNVLLVLLGGALLKIGINGDYLRYVRPAHQPWVLLGGGVMLALGALAIVRDIRAARRPAAEGHGDHQHRARSAWLLMVPVLAVLLVAPPALGSDSVERTQSRSAQGAVARGSAFPPLPPGEVVPLPISDFVTRAGWDRGGSLNGRTVALRGFVVHGDRGTLLARLTIGCCAADAYPVTVRLPGGAADALPADTWVEVTGEVVPDTARRDNGYTPDLTVAALREVPAPEDPYEY